MILPSHSLHGHIHSHNLARLILTYYTHTFMVFQELIVTHSSLCGSCSLCQSLHLHVANQPPELVLQSQTLAGLRVWCNVMTSLYTITLGTIVGLSWWSLLQLPADMHTLSFLRRNIRSSIWSILPPLMLDTRAAWETYIITLCSVQSVVYMYMHVNNTHTACTISCILCTISCSCCLVNPSTS